MGASNVITGERIEFEEFERHVNIPEITKYALEHVLWRVYEDPTTNKDTRDFFDKYVLPFMDSSIG